MSSHENIKCKAALAVFNAKSGLRQKTFEDFESAQLEMKAEYDEMLAANGLLGGNISDDFASITMNGDIVAQWSVLKIDYALPGNISTMTTISTAHIDQKTAGKWSMGYTPCGVYPKSDCGWMIYVPDEKEIGDVGVTTKAYDDVTAWARANGIDIVCLDSDADKAEGLPVYDW